jgi:uncharacterized protein (DUF983 family)
MAEELPELPAQAKGGIMNRDCPKCHSIAISEEVFLPLETVNKCYQCGYWFDAANDGPEVDLILFFQVWPDGSDAV